MFSHGPNEPIKYIRVLWKFFPCVIGTFQNADVAPGSIQDFHKLIHHIGIAEAVMSHSRKESKLSEVNLHRAALVQLYSLLQQVSAGIVILRQVGLSQQLVKHI